MLVIVKTLKSNSGLLGFCLEVDNYSAKREWMLGSDGSGIFPTWKHSKSFNFSKSFKFVVFPWKQSHLLVVIVL